MNWKHWHRIFMKAAQSILSEKLYLETKKHKKYTQNNKIYKYNISDFVKP